MPRVVSRRIFPGVRSAGYHPLSPLSWTPPHTLGGAFGAAIFFVITALYGFFLRRHFIIYEAPPAIVGGPAREPPADSKRVPAMRANDSKSSGTATVLLGVATIALGGMVGTIGLIRQVGELGPKVGDIVVFDPLDPISRDMHMGLSALPANGQSGIACVLDVRTMHTNGGSVVIEAHEPRASFGYRVHWAGVRSSDDGTNCGSNADLLMSLEDVEVLAMAAGGYGVPAARQSAFSRRSATAE
jgi:hypothetical protein